MNKTKRMMFMAIMVANSMILYIIESMLPGLYFIAPGAKLGLSNIITMSLLYIGGYKMAMTVLLMRIALSSAFGGGFSGFIYSLSGGVLSLSMMWLIKSIQLQCVSEVGISVIGAIFFNIGQLLAAAIMISNFSIFVYLPIMCYVSVGTGMFVGFVVRFLNKKLKPII